VTNWHTNRVKQREKIMKMLEKESANVSEDKDKIQFEVCKVENQDER
jgi:hypothetical protein